MKKTIKQKSQEEQVIDILKRVAKRVEETTVDIHSIKFDLKAMKLDMMDVQSNSAIIKVDTEKVREQLEEVENRLGKRITKVGDLIIVALTQKHQKLERRVAHLEQTHHTV